MGMEIYSKLYLSMIKSMQKKLTKSAIQQRNENFKIVKGEIASGVIEGDMIANDMISNGVIGGGDCFTIIGDSGIGKSSAIQRAISLISQNQIIALEKPFVKIAPCIVIQCPFDCSIKGMLLEILRQIDNVIGSEYYEKAINARATIDTLIGSVSQASLNHIGLLVVDEIQNVVNHRGGMQLISALTQLINHSNISICMVGTPKVEQFFESVNYLARRALGLRYGTLAYDKTFQSFCEIAFSFQYVKNHTTINEGICEWLYQHSGGTLANVITILHDAQEIAILNGRETLDMESMNMAYQKRMGMLHSHLQPCITKNVASKPTKEAMPKNKVPTHKVESDINLISLVEEAKAKELDVVTYLKDKISIVEVVL
jgi:hypothetical protein